MQLEAALGSAGGLARRISLRTFKLLRPARLGDQTTTILGYLQSSPDSQSPKVRRLLCETHVSFRDVRRGTGCMIQSVARKSRRALPRCVEHIRMATSSSIRCVNTPTFDGRSLVVGDGTGDSEGKKEACGLARQKGGDKPTRLRRDSASVITSANTRYTPARARQSKSLRAIS